jgi:hypothetical protein
MPIKGCEQCKLIPAGVSKRTGKEYKAFYSCPNPECPNYKPQIGGQKKMPVVEADLSSINKRLDSMAQWMAEQFDEIMTKLIDLERK